MKGLLYILVAFFFVFASLAGSIVKTSPASALTGASWRAGRIIDDPIFTSKGSMSVSQIQSFLNNKMPDCDEDGSEPSEYGGGTRAQYGAANGNAAPFTCLKDYWEVPKTQPGSGVPASNYGGKPRPSGSRSAARLIWDAAQVYNISPKVLLVTLQKEQGLITDEWPFKKQYLYAMGAHCPDGPNGAQCDSKYAGFSLQMREGAELFQYYLTNMTKSWWPYKKPYKNNSILWQDPNVKNCGSGTVYIQTRATAALYTYTPYQPNKAALDNLYGTGNSCSAYGNRNFWRTFNDWFGSTLTNPAPDKHTVGDWDGDGQDEIGLRRLDEHFLNYNHSAPAEEELIYGLSTDQFLVGDWDGDGQDEIGHKRGNNYSFDTNNDGVTDIKFAFGRTTDKPFVGDWNKDGRDDVGLRRSKHYFFDFNKSSGAETSFSFGKPTDKVIYGDWEGDGRDEIGLRRGNHYYFSFGLYSGPDVDFTFGKPTDSDFVGDWDNDVSGQGYTRDEIGLRRGKQFFLTYGLVPGTDASFSFGRNTDSHFIGDWDGDGRDELGLRRGKFYYLNYNYSPGVDVSYSFGR